MSQKYSIAFCCDFFYPRIGGVEMHIFQLALKLMDMGHKVIVITHQYGDRQGVRYVTNGLKVYYCPQIELVDGVIFTSNILMLPLMRNIFIREKVQIVHGHAATSVICQEAMIHSSVLNLKSVFTDHSLFGFDDAASIHVNKLLKFYLSDIDHAISVSHTSKENLTLRAQLDPRKIAVIPNAVDCNRFKPDKTKRFPKNTFNIVNISRQCYRKGTDLLLDIIPKICDMYQDVHFIIGGGGQKLPLLEKMITKFNLQDRVELLGPVAHKDVRDVLVRGHLFLNTSITEAFCIANVEAASSGLVVVSTNVGGIPEVLPDHMVYLSDPNPQSMIEKLKQAIPVAKKIDTSKFQQELIDKYNWQDVAQRTEKIYDKIMKQPDLSIQQRINRYLSVGKYAGFILVSIYIFALIINSILDIIHPKKDIEESIEFPHKEYNKTKQNFNSEHKQNLDNLQHN